MEALMNLPLHKVLSIQYLMFLSRYFLLAGAAYIFFWVIKRKDYEVQIHNPKLKDRTGDQGRDVAREIKYSVMSLTMFLLPSAAVISFSDIGFMKLYYNFSDYSIGHYILTYVLMFIWHDTYFYWTHRALHTKLLYRRFHNLHHKSIYPTPWAAFAFGPGEAMVHAFTFLGFAMLIPTHASVFPIFTLYSVMHNIYGHLGMDIFTKDRRERGLFKYFNHPTHHSVHHRYNKGNFGLYLRFWDKVCGTWNGELDDHKKS